MPVPLAAGLYGVLLGLGFTTFILTFAVWALAGVSVALGDPQLGLLVGARLRRSAARCPSWSSRRCRHGLARGAHAAMAERPAILRGLRAADAVALSLCALTLATAPAQAAQRAKAVAGNASDPSATADLLAWAAPGGVGYFRQGATTGRRRAPTPRSPPAGWPGSAMAPCTSRAPRRRARHPRARRRRARRGQRLGGVAQRRRRARRPAQRATAHGRTGPDRDGGDGTPARPAGARRRRAALPPHDRTRLRHRPARPHHRRRGTPRSQRRVLLLNPSALDGPWPTCARPRAASSC